MNNSFTIFAGRANVALATSVAVRNERAARRVFGRGFRTASCRCDWMSLCVGARSNHSTDLAAGQRPSDRAGGLCRRVPPRIGRAHHRRSSPYFSLARR